MKVWPKENKGFVFGPNPPPLELKGKKNPIIFLFSRFGINAFFILFAPLILIIFLNFNPSGLFVDIYFIIAFGLVVASLSWLTLKQNYWLYKFVGISLILTFILIIIFWEK
jgi:hypothetical protein